MDSIVPWQPQPNNIYHMDALTLLRHMPDNSVDLIVTDPPYGLNGKAFNVESKSYRAVRESWDDYVPTDWFYEIERALKQNGSVVCFGVRQSIYQIANIALMLEWKLINDITWFKPDAVPNFTGRMMTESTERALWFSPSGANWIYNLDVAKTENNGLNLRDVWSINTQRGNRHHPTQKPMLLIERLIKLLSNPNALVLDPFMGSGTTAVAAQRLGRQYIGCDISAEYVEIARRRVQNADPYQQTTLGNGLVQKSLFAEVMNG